MTYNELRHLLTPLYGDDEAKAMARMVYDVRFGLSLADICIGKDTQLSANSQAELREIAERLLRQEPVQYVLGQATFCGRTFHVDERVLIPRPETEELCRWILEEKATNILDIGTGSGCIAVTLAAELPLAQVTAWDLSEGALEVAKENARRHQAAVRFEQVDALCIQQTPIANGYDLIVSNPPYICRKEAEAMEANVLEHEPHTALFVPDDDPLLFYRAIARYGMEALCDGGWLYFEINPLYADMLAKMLSSMAYHDIETRHDQYGKLRMTRAQR